MLEAEDERCDVTVWVEGVAHAGKALVGYSEYGSGYVLHIKEVEVGVDGVDCDGLMLAEEALSMEELEADAGVVAKLKEWEDDIDAAKKAEDVGVGRDSAVVAAVGDGRVEAGDWMHKAKCRE